MRHCLHSLLKAEIVKAEIVTMTEIVNVIRTVTTTETTTATVNVNVTATIPAQTRKTDTNQSLPSRPRSETEVPHSSRLSPLTASETATRRKTRTRSV